jgi:hypothetical protein
MNVRSWRDKCAQNRPKRRKTAPKRINQRKTRTLEPFRRKTTGQTPSSQTVFAGVQLFTSTASSISHQLVDNIGYSLQHNGVITSEALTSTFNFANLGNVVGSFTGGYFGSKAASHVTGIDSVGEQTFAAKQAALLAYFMAYNAMLLTWLSQQTSLFIINRNLRFNRPLKSQLCVDDLLIAC